MASGSDDGDDVVSSPALMDKKTATNRQQIFTFTATLTPEPPLPTLPFDLVSEILCRLPVKLLLQLRYLCKSLNSLISDPKFAKKHLRLSIKRHHLIGGSLNDDSSELLLFDSPIPSGFSTSRIISTQLDHPITHDRYPKPPLRLSSCDGILCFTMDHSSAVLWNPSIRKFKLLPPLKNPLKVAIRSSYSLGYDHFIDNYKVVAISFFMDKCNEVNVHTLGTDSWRRIQDFPYPHLVCARGVFVSRTVNWLVHSYRSSRAIVSLDLEKESYQKLSHPNLEKGLWTLGVVRDCLCIFAQNNKMFLDVWIMKEYGNKESWTKLYWVPLMSRLYNKTLYIFEDEQLLIDFYDSDHMLKLIVYDSKNGTSKILEILDINYWIKPEVYIESLISP
jgi:F-box interacting protein